MGACVKAGRLCLSRSFAGTSKRQEGQALVLALVCMLVFVVGVLVLFNTGQVVNKKVQLNNTADAAAYSAAVQQARAYNLIAYLNRAQVANEVAVAQMVSMHSWMNYIISGTDNFADAANEVGVILDLTGVGAEVGVALNEMAAELQEIKQGMQQLRNVMKGTFSAAIAVLSGANVLYADASRAVGEAQILDIPSVVNTVIKKNTVGAAGTTDKEASLSPKSLVLLESQLFTANRKYLKLYQIPRSASPSSNPRHTTDADRYANVVMEARDGFSAKRNGDLLFIHKRGGTDLVSYNRWVALDSLHAKLGSGIFTLIDVPLAWGGAAAVRGTSGAAFANLADKDRGWNSPYDNDRGFKQAYAGGGDNHKAGKNARRHPAEPSNNDAILTGYQGLQSYEDIAANRAVVPYDESGKQDVGPIFSVLVEQKMSDVRTTSHIDGMGGPPDLKVPDKAQHDKMTALATAQVYFDRPRTLFPRNADKRRELGNLFSPYWQARLVDTPESVKVEIFGADMVGL